MRLLFFWLPSQDLNSSILKTQIPCSEFEKYDGISTRLWLKERREASGLYTLIYPCDSSIFSQRIDKICVNEYKYKLQTLFVPYFSVKWIRNSKECASERVD